jgi:hypothetical protein
MIVSTTLSIEVYKCRQLSAIFVRSKCARIVAQYQRFVILYDPNADFTT